MSTPSLAIKVKIPFHRAPIGEEEVRAVSEVIRSGWLTMGPKTLEFEREFAAYVGVKYAVAVSSCTAALHLCLEAIGVGEGDEVLVPTTTFTATAEVVTYLGARPVLVDVDPETLNLDVADAQQRINARTRAIIPVHFGGQPCDIAEIHDLASRNKLHVVEDAAHALPASYHGKAVGSISEMTAFSFYATKTLCTGEGGMVTTDNEDHARRMQMMRLHGISRDAWKRYSSEGSWYYEVNEAGFKYNLTDLQSAIGIAQLSKCHRMWEARRNIAKQYTSAFDEIESLQVPIVREDRTTAWHLYVLRLHLERLSIDRDRFIRELDERGVNTSVHFIPLHLHPYYQRKWSYRSTDFPVASAEYYRSLSLPLFPTMTDEEVDSVITAVRNVAKRFAT
jgi:perosamine synthetase